MEVADYFVDLKGKKYTLEKIDKPLLEIVDILGLDEDKDIDDIEEAEKVLNYALKYAQERKNKKNGIKTFTLNESVLLMTSFLSYFDFKYLFDDLDVVVLTQHLHGGAGQFDEQVDAHGHIGAFEHRHMLGKLYQRPLGGLVQTGGADDARHLVLGAPAQKTTTTVHYAPLPEKAVKLSLENLKQVTFDGKNVIK